MKEMWNRPWHLGFCWEFVVKIAVLASGGELTLTTFLAGCASL
jgi:hypothetical protein